MPTKTDRILSYLPGTFLALPRPTALYSVADAFGNELLQAENTLVAVMRSHWVDTADQGDEIIDDLARIASLYGLAPRDDETVEDFRAHLKRYVRTFIEGTPTVQGALRLTAEALSLLIADSYDQMDTWWTRPQPDAPLVSAEPQGDDVSALLFAPTALTARGSASQPASISGTADLSGGVDLRAASKLALEIDGAAPVVVDLGSLPGDRSAAKLSDIVTAINTKLAAQVASSSPDGKRLILSSPTLGAASTLKVDDVAGDAAPALLGLRPRTYAGTKDVSAQVVGTIDLGAGVDLSVRRYLRLLIDGTHLAEIDCAGSSPAATKLNDIRDAINKALGLTVASHDGHFLTLTSPTTRFSSVIQFQSPAAQDATQTLFGPVNGIYTGKSAQPAVVTGSQDLSHGLDLSQNCNIEFALDGGAHLLVKCAGANPAATGPDEIVTAINTAAGPLIASQDGRFVTLTSTTQGPGSSIQFFTPAAADATFAIFGLAPRQAAGQAANAATLAGLAIAGGKLDLAAQHLLQVALDSGSPTVVDFWNGSGDLRAVTLDDIAQAINAAANATVASHDTQHLILTSRVVGASSSVAVVPLARTILRRFVTRAFVTDEASQKTLGVFRALTHGSGATPARVEGTAELSRGINLRDDPFLQLKIDGGPAITIDCSAGVPRPRIALPTEVVAAINIQIDPDGHSQVASTDGHHLFFTSPTTGAGSTIEFQPVPASDALSTLGLQPTTVFGHDATRVSFLSTVDLSAGMDLSAASKVKLAIDGAAPVEIDCAGPDPAHTSLSQIVTRINTPLNTSIAAPVGKTIALTSPSAGAKSKIEFLAPSSNDATQLIFGVGARAYQGQDALPPQVTGSEIKNVATGVDLHQARFLSVAVDGGKALAIDCSAGAADATKVKLPEITAAINKAANQQIASSADGKKLTLTGLTAAASGRLTLDTVASGGAFARLMGSADQTTHGADPAPATITGIVDLLAGVNLDERRILRLAVDGARPLDIDISGAQPDKTFLDEIVAKINAVSPGVASASADDHLVLTSPTRGEESSLEVLPIRVLEVQEYPLAEAEQNFSLQPGDKFSVNNQGAADSELTIEIQAPQGVAGAELVNRSSGVRIRVLDAVPAGGLLKLWNDAASGLKAVIVTAQGKKFYVSDSNILAGPLGSQAVVPFSGAWRLSGGAAGARATLQLNNPQVPSITVVEARRRGLQGSKISVEVAEAALPPLPAVTADGSRARLVGRLRFSSGAYSLVDGNNAPRAGLRVGAGVTLGPAVDKVVLVQGPLFPGEGTPPVMVVESVAALFDVTIEGSADDGSDVVETYAGVCIGGASDSQSLVYQIFSKPSALAVAEELEKSSPLQLPRGRSDWSYLAAAGSRFDYATFNHSDFAGGPCLEQGVFDASRFSYMPPEAEAAVFAGPVTDPPVQVTLRWRNYGPGSFVVNLPADLPENFGGRFNQARFALPGEAPEVYGSVVMEPQNDKDYITTRINQSSSANPKSTLVKATLVDRVPLGWDPMLIPFHHPRSQPLTGGTDTDPAAIYLAEADVPGFIELKALAPGKWGNPIEVTARKASPGRFDVTIGYQAARFENARQVVFAGRILAPGEDPLPALTDEVLKPRPVGIVQGKAAGVLVHVTRDGTESQQ